MIKFVLLVLLSAFNAQANPYFDPNEVPKDRPYVSESLPQTEEVFNPQQLGAIEVLRVRVDWAPGEKFTVGRVVKEMSGTSALLARSRLPSPYGSYIGTLRDASGQLLSMDQIGTGQEYRKLVRAFTFRFPVPVGPVTFDLFAENPNSGMREKVLTANINTVQVPRKISRALEVRLLKPATVSPSVKLAIFAEGYLEEGRSRFWSHTQQIIQILSQNQFPELERLEILGVFSPSNVRLGEPKDGPLPVTPRDSFLGFYYPYWEKFNRWYNVVYPTSEEKFRSAIGDVPYDYPLALIDDSHYWGVGNFKSFTAIPMVGQSTTYLLLHEFGHFFGLNEEYEGGGPTELEFAPNIQEPWSQNITFLRSMKYDDLKWKGFVDPKTPIPTPNTYWGGSKLGVYLGGYGDSSPKLSHKPGFSCIMDRYKNFCPICKTSIKAEIMRDSGLVSY